MNDAESYDKNSDVQINLAKDFIAYFLSKMKFKPGENVLDFGCGSGYVTRNVLLPALENAHADSERKIYGVDIMPNMTEFASKNYDHPQITYTAMDIQKDKAEFPYKFDKVFSFGVLHWISDQADLLQKLSSLMNQGGEISCYLGSTCSIFLVYDILRKDPEFAPYIIDGEKFIPKSINSPSPVEDLTGYLKSAGFAVQECSLLPKDTIFSDTQALIEFLMACDPFIGGIPTTLRESYKKRYLEEIIPFLGKVPSSEDESGLKYRFFYDLLLVRGQKL